MNDFTVCVSRDGDMLTLHCDARELGSQYDSEAQRLVFERPDAFADSDLLLFFSDGTTKHEPVNLGTENEYVITGDLTQGHRLELQAAFFKNGAELEHSNIISFSLRSSMGGVAETGPSLPGKVRRLESQSFASAERQDGAIIFHNLEGEQVVVLPLSGTEGGQSGDTGAPAPEDAVTSVNGLGPVDGDISLTAGNIPYGGDSVAVCLDKLSSAMEPRTYTGKPVRAKLPQNWIQNVELCGRTRQNGIASPTAPAALEGVSASLHVTGPNLFMLTQRGSGTLGGEVEWSIDNDGVITLNTPGGAATKNYDFVLSPSSSQYFPLPGGTYTLSAELEGSKSGRFDICTRRNTNTEHINLSVEGGNAFAVRTVPSGLFRYDMFIRSGFSANHLKVRIMLCHGGTALPYQPYSGKLYGLADTSLYGPPQGISEPGDHWNAGHGTLDTRYSLISFNGSEDWKQDTGDLSLFTIDLPQICPASSDDEPPKISCTHYQCVSMSQLTGGSYQTGAASGVTAGRICFRDTSHADAGAFKAWLAGQHSAGTPLSVCVPLASPETRPETPLQIENPAGEIIVSGDGDMTLTTRRATDLWELISAWS